MKEKAGAGKYEKERKCKGEQAEFLFWDGSEHIKERKKGKKGEREKNQREIENVKEKEKLTINNKVLERQHLEIHTILEDDKENNLSSTM